MSVKVLPGKIDLSRKSSQAAHRIAGKVREQAQKTGLETYVWRTTAKPTLVELFTKTTSPGSWERPHHCSRLEFECYGYYKVTERIFYVCLFKYLAAKVSLKFCLNTGASQVALL